MQYIDIYKLLKSKACYVDDYIEIDDKTVIRNFTFTSANASILPGEPSYSCLRHNFFIEASNNFDNETGVAGNILDIQDSQVADNATFRYHILMPKGVDKAEHVVLMLHGFNEKDWYKYLPWAKYIVESTGKSVVLFPIAFHMNRAPHAWSDSRLMFKASCQRKELFPNILHSSLSNVAISTRIHAKPQRFIWSGLQTYYDIISFISQCKAGGHPALMPNASVDIFAYSIGAFLAQILMMTNHQSYFDQSKLAIFCGGAVFNRLSPVSKFILDSEANVNLYSFIVEHLESHIKNDSHLNHYLNNPEHPEGLSFQSMLNYKKMSDLREASFRSMSNRIMAVVLEQDSVVPPYEVANTLHGKGRDIPILVKALDFPYPYKHEDPFPASEKLKNEVDKNFVETMELFCDFLK